MAASFDVWAFEWHDPSKPIKINRGEPLFYATFETLPQDRSVAMAEVEVTPERGGRGAQARNAGQTHQAKAGQFLKCPNRD